MDTLHSDPYSRSSLQLQIRDGSMSFENNSAVLDKHEVVSPRVGMTFETVDLAYQFYLEYGYRAGFGVSKRTSHSVDGVKYRATFVCYKGGIARIKPGLKARRRLVAKTGCKAMMVVKFNASENHWEVVFVELEHNHPCNPEMVRFMMCFKDLPDWQREHRPFNAKTRLNPKIHSGRGRPPNQNKDFMVRSFSQSNYSIDGAGKTGKLRFAEGDVEALLVFFDKMQAQNSNFFYNWDMDDEGRLKNVCWVDARSRVAYQHFCDVICFDTVYLTYQFVIPLVAFLGINHHGQFVLLGCGLLGDESPETFAWLFKKWLKCMNDKSPEAIVTTHSRPVVKAVSEVFPNTRHRYNLWHIMKELPEMSGRVEDKEAVSLRMKKVVYDTITSADFEREWAEMINQYNLHDNQWLTTLFEERAKWVPAYVKDTFWAGISTVRRSERLEAFFDGYITPETTIKTFIEQFDTAMKLRSDREAYDDFRSFQQRPQVLSGLLFEEQFANVYTINMFQKFQDQLKQLMNVNCTEVSRNGSIVTYTVTVIGKERKFDYRVMYNSAEKEVWCICRSFQFKGILCSHALAVLKQELVMLIPPKYILDRWRKDYKCPEEPKETPISQKAAKDTGKGSKPENIREDQVDNLYKHGHQYFADIVEMGATDPDAMEYVLSVMKEAKEKVRKFEESRKEKRPGEGPVSAGKKGAKFSKPSTQEVGNTTSVSTPTEAVASVTVVSSPPMAAAPTMMAMAPPSAAVAGGMFLVPMHPHPLVFPPFPPAVPPAVAPVAPPAAPATNVVSNTSKKRKKRKGNN
ncbi:protein FAR1-RELATED SEQUENCE 6 [Zea mays]|jgi:hypothetical protein|uniref:Protein FAR1-RELATED SEQUENCE n=1 Tax=Zea mays TaxID=4577 RepID=A0A1D6E8G6_MAIZE|nr:protein FAR1-RELATED SEQUENCE 6 [Zea mays]XP_008669270.1 protein FAR1-RELATED SEQUENCE 6 [Zea mays]XP_008669271.1 protein FAR1-RELATED SEQUENCE 6 [Zea mays]XP_008669273.1 protein FAR1-RELATED SEQUENCE 6 [Zea mays]XP_020403857.1 protein FAR1-RELATED SEQUENCE 6 [Zea mays]XP_023157376.1 protein FAR1-RELATED SEQUENCE 6 [Zea mays]XP_035821142.1 protein FAR1-RELATED SEQUENCE 6 [Zea mays]XP_035821143.1 protein FAR1-RELATED SEQUENCE 6 [Zea mays]XP_035821144.1 protein FAR1-RELATED SEQUENCE 6 [Zea|eukprot:XP_008669269.1 protein FAR1-RELATED SEQUENCE 6 [Zea mays]